MDCQWCGSPTRVVDSRKRNSGTIIYRRRECMKCLKRFSTKEFIKSMNTNNQTIIDNIRKEIRKYLIKSELKSVVIGVSGGIDSTLCCALIQPVCEFHDIQLIGRSISIESNKPDELKRARDVGRAFCSDFKEIDLTFQYQAEVKTIETIEKFKLSKIAQGNLKARIRMRFLYALAGENKGMVLSTDNWTEFLLGFYTLHGDVGDYGMIQNLYKSEVYNLTEYLRNVLNNSDKDIDKKRTDALTDALYAIPTDGLGITDSDLDQIMPEWNNTFNNCRDAYSKVDTILQEYVDMIKIKADKEILAEKEKNPVIQRHLNTKFKRNNPYNIPRETLIVN